MAEEPKYNQWEQEPAKFMANIFTDPKNVTRRMPSLDFIDENLLVPQIRILYVVGGLIAFALLDVIIIMNTGTATRYVALPLFLLLIPAVIIGLLSLLNYDGKSYFAILRNFLKFQRNERNRRKGKKNITSLGVEEIDPITGRMTFKNGDVGDAFLIEGFVGKTMLPSTISMVRKAQLNYLIVREQQATEKKITHIERSNPKSQIANLDRQIKYHTAVAQETGDPTMVHAWSNFMLNAQKNYIKKYIAEKEFVIAQYLILRSIDDKMLEKTKEKLLNAADAGLYAKIQQLSKPEIEQKIGAVVLYKPSKKKTKKRERHAKHLKIF